MCFLYTKRAIFFIHPTILHWMDVKNAKPEQLLSWTGKGNMFFVAWIFKAMSNKGDWLILWISQLLGLHIFDSMNLIRRDRIFQAGKLND